MKHNHTIFIFYIFCLLFASCTSISPEKIAIAKLESKSISFDKDFFCMVANDGDMEAVKLFIEAGMPAESITEDKEWGIMSPLFASICEGHTDVASFLINKGATKNELVGQLALFYAVKARNAEITKQLLDKGIKANMDYDEGTTLLMIACGAEKEKFLRTDYPYDENLNLEIVKLLLNAGAKVNAKDKKGCTALFYACLCGRKDIAKLLLNAGTKIENDIIIDVAEVGELKGMPTLAAASSSGNLELVKLLVNKGAKINSSGSCLFFMVPPSFKYVGKGKGKGFSPLHSACYAGRKNIIEFLLKQGADINAKDARGKTPIMFARSKNIGINSMFMRPEKIKKNDPVEMIKFILAKGGKIKNVLLFEAVKNGHIKTVLFLLEKGVPIDSRDEKGMTSLMLTGKNKHKDLYDILVKKGAKIDLKDKDGKTAKAYLEDKQYSMGGLMMPTLYGVRKSPKKKILINKK